MILPDHLLVDVIVVLNQDIWVQVLRRRWDNDHLARVRLNLDIALNLLV